MLQEYLDKLRFILKWSICYHEILCESHIPNCRNYLEKLRSYPKSIPSQYVEYYANYTGRTFVYLIHCQLFAIAFDSFIHESSICLDNITRQYKCLFKKI